MKKLLSLMMLAAVMTACSSDDEATPTPVKNYPLSISVKETPYVNPDGDVKAAISTTSTLNAFNIDYQYGTTHGGVYQATKNGDKTWTTTGSWPERARENDVNVDWYAYTDGTFHQGDNAKPCITFTVDENPSAQKDFLVATASDKWSSCNGNLSFTFDHACAALKFFVKKAKNISDYKLAVSEVKLCNVVKAGNYYFDTASWTLANVTSSYTLYLGTDKILGDNYEAIDASDAPYLFLLPQTLTPWGGSGTPANTYLELTCSIKKGETDVYSGEAYIPFGATLEKGIMRNVNINIGKNSLYKNDGTKVITE